jgi:hypothetical protein
MYPSWQGSNVIQALEQASVLDFPCSSLPLFLFFFSVFLEPKNSDIKHLPNNLKSDRGVKWVFIPVLLSLFPLMDIRQLQACIGIVFSVLVSISLHRRSQFDHTLFPNHHSPYKPVPHFSQFTCN